MDSNQDTDAAPPERKKRRTKNTASADVKRTNGKGKGKARVKGKTGRLAFILQLPMEIILEILSYLRPVDIVNLSYVDKELHVMLSLPSAKSIWVAARENVPGLPECPPDFTESGYARFLFLKSCESCGRLSHGLPGMPYVRVRLCQRCNKSKMVSQVHVAERLGLDLEPDVHVRLLPSYCGAVFEPSLNALVRRMEIITDSDERNAFIDTRDEFVRIISEHASRLRTWLEATWRATFDDGQRVREQRLEAIRTRFANLGHHRQDMKSWDFVRHRLVDQTAALTDRSWNNVRHRLEAVIERNKSDRLKEELLVRNKGLLIDYLSDIAESLPSAFEDGTFPPLLDLLKLPSVLALSESDIPVDAFSATFQAAIPSVMQDIAELKGRMQADLLKIWDDDEDSADADETAGLLKTNIANVATSSGILRLASTVFSCKRSGCYVPLHYSTLKIHVHYTYQDAADDEEDFEEADGTFRRRRWSAYLRDATVKPHSKSIMLSIIKAAGLDEEKATPEDLTAIGPRFCLSRGGIDSDAGKWQEVYQALMARHNQETLPGGSYAILDGDSLMGFDLFQQSSFGSHEQYDCIPGTAIPRAAMSTVKLASRS